MSGKDNQDGEAEVDGWPMLRPLEKPQAGELARLTLAFLGQRKASPIPLNYALGFFHHAGVDQGLDAELEERFGTSGPWNHAQAVDLFLRHLTPCGNQRTLDLQREVVEMVATIEQALRETSEHAGERSERLRRHVDRLGRNTDPAQALVIATDMLREARGLCEETKAAASEMAATRQSLLQVQRELARVREEASQDALTGLHNRRVFDVSLAEQIEGDRPFVLILMDIDHFKQINDQYGHPIADRVLRQLARLVKARVRASDIAARYGGEEFAVILPNTTLTDGAKVAEKLRVSIEQLRLRKREDNVPLPKVTASFGVADYEPGEGVESLIHRTDCALYRAKEAGRNTVVVAAGSNA